jgi:hypothetical protein
MHGIISEPITLLPPGLEVRLSTYRILYGVLLGLMIFIGLGRYHYWGLNLVQLAFVMAAPLILLLNVYFFVLRKRKEANRVFIWIDLDEIQLFKKGIILYKDSLKNLRVIKIVVPANPKNVPTTLLIEGKQFPRLFIRSAQSVKDWTSREHVYFSVASEKEWKYLLQALAACEQYA